MAYETGTATNYLDLLSKLETFLTTDAGLIADGEEWTVLRDDLPADAIYFQAPGLTGTEQIYVNINTFTVSGGYQWALRGATGYLADQIRSAQPGVSPEVYLPLWNSTITYWFIANGQRCIIIAKVGSVYLHAYLGKFLPYGTPTEYSLPLFIGGSSYLNTTLYSNGTGALSGYFQPSAATGLSTTAGANVLRPSGTWTLLRHIQASGSVLTSPNEPIVSPWWLYGGDLFTHLREGPSNEHALLPAVICDGVNGDVLGELDGVYFATGSGVASEDTVTVGGDTYLLIQNCFRTSAEHFAAFKLA